MPRNRDARVDAFTEEEKRAIWGALGTALAEALYEEFGGVPCNCHPELKSGRLVHNWRCNRGNASEIPSPRLLDSFGEDAQP